MTVLTAPDILAADASLTAPAAGILAVGARMLAERKLGTDFIERWLTWEVDNDPRLRLLLTGQECPGCYAVHDETAWPREGMDDGWCSQACQDDAASAMDEARTRARWAA